MSQHPNSFQLPSSTGPAVSYDSSSRPPVPTYTLATAELRSYELEYQARLQAYYQRPPTSTSPEDASLFSHPGGDTATTLRYAHRRKGFDMSPAPPPLAFVDIRRRQYPLEAWASIPRPSLAEVPVECELCLLHEQEDRAWYHIHSVDFRDCFTTGPSDEGGAWRSVDSCRVTRHVAQRYPPQPFPEAIARRNAALSEIVLQAVGRAEEDERSRAPMPWWRTHVEAYPPAPVWRQQAAEPGPRAEPLWTGRPCPRCSLADDFGSFVHVHMPQRGLCFTFGERGSHTLVKQGLTRFPLLAGEEERRRDLQDRLEDHVRRALRRFYTTQNHLSLHRLDWENRLAAAEIGELDAPPWGETACRTVDGRWKFECCEEEKDYGYFRSLWYFC